MIFCVDFTEPMRSLRAFRLAILCERLPEFGQRFLELGGSVVVERLAVADRSEDVGFLVTQGFLDNVETRDVVRYEAAMLSFLRNEKADVLKSIRDSKALDDDTAAKLKDALKKPDDVIWTRGISVSTEQSRSAA